MSYGSKLPPPLLTPASFSLRGAGVLVATAFLVSMVLMGALMHSVGVDGITPNQLRNDGESLATLRLSAAERDSASVPAQVLQQLDVQLSDGAEDNDGVRVAIAFEDPVAPGQFVPVKEVSRI
jgi:hypothetical protein